MQNFKNRSEMEAAGWVSARRFKDNHRGIHLVSRDVTKGNWFGYDWKVIVVDPVVPQDPIATERSDMLSRIDTAMRADRVWLEEEINSANRPGASMSAYSPASLENVEVVKIEIDRILDLRDDEIEAMLELRTSGAIEADAHVRLLKCHGRIDSENATLLEQEASERGMTFMSFVDLLGAEADAIGMPRPEYFAAVGYPLPW